MVARKDPVVYPPDMASIDLNLQDMIDGLEDEFLVVDTEYRVKFANSAMQDRLPEGIRSPVGKHCYRIFQGRDEPCSTPLWDCPLREVLKSGSLATVIHSEHLDAEGACQKYVAITAYPLRDSTGKINAVAELRKDITAEKQLDNQILRRYRELSALSQISAAVSGLWDLDAILSVALDNLLAIMNGTTGGILLLDEQTQTLCYRVHRGLSGKYITEMCLNVGEGIAGQVAQTGKPALLEDISLDPHAAKPDLISTEGLRAFISVPLRAKEKVLGVINVASHVPHHFEEDDMYLLSSIGDQIGIAIEEAGLYDQLRKERENYRRLARYMLIAQEEERRRVARELHDETGQSLTALSLNIQALLGVARISHLGDVEFQAKLEQVHNMTVQLNSEISRLMKNLMPTILDGLGLVPAIRQYAEASLQPLGINIWVGHEGMEKRLPLEMEAGLFRIAQGAIGNIARHSEAENAAFKVEHTQDELMMQIEDDGKGFDASRPVEVDETGHGRGLFGMKERASLLGGTCTIQSQAGKGTRVIVRVPTPSERSYYAKDKSDDSR